LNTLVGEFMNQNVETRWSTMQRTSDFLARQLDDLRAKLQRSAQELQNYARSAGLMSVSERDNLADEKLRSLQGELSKAQYDRIAKQLRHELAAANPAAIGDVLNDDQLRRFEIQLADLRREHADLAGTFTPEHYKVKRVQGQIAEMQAAIQRQRVNILERLKNEFGESQRKEIMLANAYRAQSGVASEQAQKGIQYNILKREVDANQQLYEAILQKEKEIGITSAMRASNIRVIDPASPPYSPSGSNVLLFPLVGLMGGALLGITFAITRDRTDPSLRAPGDGPVHLRIPELGVVPSTSKDPQKLEPANGAMLSFLTATSSGDPHTDLVVARNPACVTAEAFRSTMTSILFARSLKERPGVIVVTSPGSGEGKSTCVSNLGICMAETGRRVLLIDADMRNPKLHQLFGMTNSWGLSKLLEEASDINAIPGNVLGRPTDIKNLHVLSSGPPKQAVSNLLFLPRMQQLLERTRAEYDAVLIDTPPMLPFPDVRVIAQHADGVIIVFRAGRSRRDDALAVVERLVFDGSTVIGTILNDWDPKLAGHGYYQAYSRYYAAAAGAE
jgi:capsular exopolysaccharide synthesis family protein